jgi:hypothetical protein
MPNSGACTAFPTGIPLPFLRGEELHDEPHPDDHGTRYERNPVFDGIPNLEALCGTGLKPTKRRKP